MYNNYTQEFSQMIKKNDIALFIYFVAGMFSK